MTIDEQLHEIALRINWFEPPEEMVRQPDRFLLYFMQYGLDTDVPFVRRHFSKEAFRQAIERRPPGILDRRSVNYWQLVLSE